MVEYSKDIETIDVVYRHFQSMKPDGYGSYDTNAYQTNEFIRVATPLKVRSLITTFLSFPRPESKKDDFRLYFKLFKKSYRGHLHIEITKTKTNTEIMISSLYTLLRKYTQFCLFMM